MTQNVPRVPNDVYSNSNGSSNDFLAEHKIIIHISAGLAFKRPKTKHSYEGPHHDFGVVTLKIFALGFFYNSSLICLYIFSFK